MQSCFVFQHILLWKDIHLEHQLWGNSMFQRVDLGQAGSSKSYSDMETDWHCLTSKKVTGFYRATTWNTILQALIRVNCQEKHTLSLEFMGKKTLVWKMCPSLASSESWSTQLMVSLICMKARCVIST